jgi:hypothetical protein
MLMRWLGSITRLAAHDYKAAPKRRNASRSTPLKFLIDKIVNPALGIDGVTEIFLSKGTSNKRL